MSENILSVTTREGKGRGNARRLRAQGKIPAVIYGKSGSFNLSVMAADFQMLLRKIAGATAVITLRDEKNKAYQALIHEWQRDPVTDRFVHIDFLEVVANQKIGAHLGIHIKGESIGVKNGGGVLELHVHEVEISALPKDLPEQILLDVSALDLGSAIHLKDLPQFPGVEYLGEPDVVIVSCTEPRVEASSAAGDSAEAEDAAETAEAAKE